MTTYENDANSSEPNSTHAIVADLVGVASRVLDVHSAFALAELDEGLLSKHVDAGSLDVVVLDGVLEHLLDPCAVLRQAATLLADGGRVVVSVPNIGHGSTRLALLQGRWSQSDPCDRTHSAFYTRAALLELITRAGMEVTDLRGTVADPLAMHGHFDADALPRGIVEWVRHQPDALVHKFVASIHPGSTTQAVAPALRPAVPISEVRARDGHTVAAALAAQVDHKALVALDASIGRRAELAAARQQVALARRRAARDRAKAERLQQQVDTLRRPTRARAARSLTAPFRLIRRRRRR